MDQSSSSYPCYSSPPRCNPFHADLLDAYGTYLVRERGILVPSGQVKVAASFLASLEASGCPLEEVCPGHIQAFITGQGRHYQRKTIAGIASFLRGFLRYLAFNRLVPLDFSGQVLRPRIFQGEREPRYLKDWQVRQILVSVDRTTAKGKRNYALLLLLAVYGLRANEVTGLRLEDFRWRAGKILIRARKSGGPMELPLTPEVAEAVAAYLSSRPRSDHREVFLNVFSPNPPLGTGGLHVVAVMAIRRCGFTVAHPGTHTFRYSRAQALFAAQHPFPDIASTLGHRDLRTTLGYLSFTVHPLREVALNGGEELA